MEIARLEQQVRDEKLASLSKAERQLFMHRESKAKEIERQRAKEAEALRKESIKPYQDEVLELFDAYKDNPAFSEDVLMDCLKAWECLEENAPPEVAAEALARASHHRDEYVNNVKQHTAQRINELREELNEFEHTYQTLTPEPESHPSADEPEYKPRLTQDPRYVELQAEYEKARTSGGDWRTPMRKVDALRVEYGLEPAFKSSNPRRESE